MTGVVKSVMTWLTSSPPIMQMPRGVRNSEPTPLPKASGTAPRSAAMVVIMMGRKRKQARLVDGFLGRLAFIALGFQGEVNHHDGVLLHDTNQQNDADQGDDVEIFLKKDQGQDRADSG